MTRITLSTLRARWRRSLATALAVALGVAFLAGTLVLGDTLGTNFDRLFREVSAGTSVVVRNADAVNTDDGPDANRGLVDERLLEPIRAVDGVAAVEGQVVGYGSLLGRDGDAIGGNGPPRLAGSWIRDRDLNPYRLVDGRAPRRADEVVVNRGAAEAGDLSLGDRTIVRTPRPVPVRIVGIADFGTSAGLGQTTFTAFTLRAAQQQVTGRPGEVSSIVVRANDGVDDAELRDRIRAVLPRGVEAITGDDLAQERVDNIASTFLDGLRAGLVVFAAVALAVATLSINNTFSITVAQRTRELALLRAIGASRRQLRLTVLGEALAVGTVASLVGLAGGVGMAGLLKGLFDAFGFALPAGGLTITPVALAAACVAGVVATVVAAQVAARRAAAVAPIEALRTAAAERATVGVRRVLVGVALVGVGAIGLVVAAATEGLMLAASSALAFVIGALVVAPVLIPPLASALGGPLRRARGAPGRFAAQNVRRNPRRSATTATALVVGVMVVSMFTLFVASLRATLDEEVAIGVTADLVVSTPAFGGEGLSPELAQRAADLPEVADALGIGGGPVRIDGDTTFVTATDVARLDRVMDLDVVAGALDGVDGDAIAVSKGTADDEGWTVGTPVTLEFPGGARQDAVVRAVFDDGDLLSSVVVPTSLWERHALQPVDRAVFVRTAPGADLPTARRALAPLARTYGGDLQDPSEFAESTTAGLDLLLGIVYVMLALAVVIALLGIANALALAVHERQREIGLLRAVGQTRRQLRASLRWESVIVAVFGTALGLVLGGVLGVTLFVVAFGGGTIAVAAPQLAVIAVLGACAGFLAGLRPARRAARLPVLDAIATA